MLSVCFGTPRFGNFSRWGCRNYWSMWFNFDFKNTHNLIWIKKSFFFWLRRVDFFCGVWCSWIVLNVYNVFYFVLKVPSVCEEFAKVCSRGPSQRIFLSERGSHWCQAHAYFVKFLSFFLLFLIFFVKVMWAVDKLYAWVRNLLDWTGQNGVIDHRPFI